MRIASGQRQGDTKMMMSPQEETWGRFAVVTESVGKKSMLRVIVTLSKGPLLWLDRGTKVVCAHSGAIRLPGDEWCGILRRVDPQ